MISNPLSLSLCFLPSPWTGGDEQAELLLFLAAHLRLHVDELHRCGNLHDPHRSRGAMGLQGPPALQNPRHEARGGRDVWTDVEGKALFVFSKNLEIL